MESGEDKKGTSVWLKESKRMFETCLLLTSLNSLRWGLFLCCMIQLVFWEWMTENTYSKMTQEHGFGSVPS